MQSGIVESGYGSDPVGLVSGFLFELGQPLREIDSTGAAAWLRQNGNAAPTTARHDQPFLWLHFNLSHSACERWMKGQLGLPEDFFEALRQGSHSTRIERQDDALLAVVNDVIYNFGVVSTDISTLWAHADHRLLVTARARPLRSVDRLRAAVRRGEPFRSPLDLVVHLLRDQADVLVQIVRETGINVD